MSRWRFSGGTLCGIVTAVCLLCLPQFALRATAADVDAGAVLAALQQSVRQAIEKAEASVVSIARKKIPSAAVAESDQLDRFRVPLLVRPLADEMKDANYIPNDFGSGIVLGEITVGNDRVTAILTNYHVVKGAETSTGQPPRTARLSVRFPGERHGKPGVIWAADPRSDLAIITIPAHGLKPIKIAAPNSYKKGDFILVLGNPYAVAHDGGLASVSWGMISNIGRKANVEIANPDGSVPDRTGAGGNERLYHLGGLLQVDARLHLGMSGGALINLKGELIGVTTALAALAGYEKSAGYAIPIDETVRRVIDTLLKGHEVEYGFLGVSLDVGARRGQRRPGVYVEKAIENLPAKEGGIAGGDIIVAVGGNAVRTQRDLMREVGKLAPGTEVKMTVIRVHDPKPRYKNVVLGKWPAKNEDEIIAPIHRYGGVWRGLVVDFTSGRFKHFPQGPPRDVYPPRGVLVSEVQSASPAAHVQLKPGDFIGRVNGREVLSPRDFYRAVDGIKDAVTLTLIRGVDRQEVVIEPN